jgi:hypothetical protein
MNFRTLLSTTSFAAVMQLSGCASFDTITNQLQTAIGPAKTTATPTQICQDFAENQIRARDLYVGKSLSVTGPVRTIDDGGVVVSVTDSIDIRSRGVNYDALKKFNVGKTATISGRIDYVSKLGRSCNIILMNSGF